MPRPFNIGLWTERIGQGNEKLKKMEIKPIKTDRDYNQALERLEVIFDSKKNTLEGDELDILSILIENYENEKFPIGFPDPIEAIKFRMEQMGYNQTDLAKILGLKSRASEILNKKRKLSLELIRKIHENLHIPAEVLVKPY